LDAGVTPESFQKKENQATHAIRTSWTAAETNAAHAHPRSSSRRKPKIDPTKTRDTPPMMKLGASHFKGWLQQNTIDKPKPPKRGSKVKPNQILPGIIHLLNA
jgi:hypothetical protein